VSPDFGPDERNAAQALIDLALAEDLRDAGDITSAALIDESARGTVAVVARQDGVLCGLPVAEMAMVAVDADVEIRQLASDGDRVAAGTTVATLTGKVRSLLAAERTVLNFLTHLSGVATATRQFVDAVSGTRAQVLDTRKTLPGWRVLQKYAVRCGGGVNHRLGLFDAVLIKDNHLAAWGESPGHPSVAAAVEWAREQVPEGTPIEVEVDTLEQLRSLLPSAPDFVLLDNMNPETLREAVAIRDRMGHRVLLEASGGVTLETVRAIAESGVDRISVGALTHSVVALDIAFDWEADR
jgi:nicotinate-nucleotide pyrophosphorylase (carboxylating)